MKRVLVACEYSGLVRDALIDQGIPAISCDVLPTDSPGPHHQGFVQEILFAESWAAVIAFPPCTFLTTSGIHRNATDPARRKKTEAAVDFVRDIWWAPTRHVAIENPVSILTTRLRKPAQYVQPHWFGESAQKKTGLWLRNLPKLRPTFHMPGRMVEWPRGSGKLVERWDNQTDAGQSVIGSRNKDRAKLRSRTYPGIATAMAVRWREILLRACEG